MPSFVELATQIVAAQASSTAMSTEEILSSLTRVHATMGQLEKGTPAAEVAMAAEAPKLTLKEAFRKNEVICLICGKSFQKLSGHLSVTHRMKPSEYRKKYNIPRTQPLCSKTVCERAKELVDQLGLPQRDGTRKKIARPAGELKRGPGRPKGTKNKTETPEKPATAAKSSNPTAKPAELPPAAM